MNNQPLVSIIIPMYNAEKYIKNTIESLLNQTYQSLEIIVVDDGSTDNSKDVVISLQQMFPEKIVYLYKNNSGVSNARNKGLDCAKGDYIGFLDSDDFYDKEKIHKQMKKLFETKTQACYCGTTEIKGENIRNYPEKFYEGNIFVPILTWKTYADTNSWIIEKNIIDKFALRFNTECNWAEDLEFFLKLTSLINVSYVDEYLTKYNRRENSLSAFGFSQLQIVGVFQRLKPWLRENEKFILSEINLDEVNILIDKYVLPNHVTTIFFHYFAYGGHKRSSHKELVEVLSNKTVLDFVKNYNGMKMPFAIKNHMKNIYVRYKIKTLS